MYVLPWRGGMQMARFRGPSGQGAGYPLRNRLKDTAVERTHNARLARQDAVSNKKLIKRRKFHVVPAPESH